MQWAPDSPDLWAPDSGHPNQWASDSSEPLTLRRAVDLFLGAKAAEGASPKTITWYRMILARAITAFGAEHPVDRLTGPDLRAWLVELRTTLAPVSVAGYVRTLKVLGNWLQAEGLGEASALRSLRKPRVPDKLIEPVSDDALRRLLGLATVRDRRRRSPIAPLKSVPTNPRSAPRTTAVCENLVPRPGAGGRVDGLRDGSGNWPPDEEKCQRNDRCSHRSAHLDPSRPYRCAFSTAPVLPFNRR